VKRRDDQVYNIK